MLACEDGWVEGSFDSCYKFETKSLVSWYDARKACQALGGELAALEDTHEIYWMRGYRSGHAALRGKAWTAGFQGKDGVWNWQYTGEAAPIKDFNWAREQPDGDGEQGRYAKGGGCLILFGERSNPFTSYHFDDDNCITKHGYICEKYVN